MGLRQFEDRLDLVVGIHFYGDLISLGQRILFEKIGVLHTKRPGLPVAGLKGNGLLREIDALDRAWPTEGELAELPVARIERLVSERFGEGRWNLEFP